MSKRLHLGWLAGLAFGLMPLVGRADVEAPLPKLEDIIKNAIERGKLEDENDLKFKQQYYFVRDRKTEIRNADGDIKKLKIRISTNTPSATIVTPENQAPLPSLGTVLPSDQAAKANSEAPADMPRKLDKNQLQFNLDLVKRFDFKLVGREQTNGYSLLVVDFTPKKTKLPEKGLRDRVVNRVAGRIWVDEREFAVKKCALKLIQNISILGGLAGEAQKFNYTFDRERTADGLWYVRDSSWHLEGRQVLVHREADYREKRSHVRKPEQPKQLSAGSER